MEVPVRATSPAAAIEQTEVDHAPLTRDSAKNRLMCA
jgi:hypothetical protein